MEAKDISSKLTAQLIREATERKHAEALINLFVKNAPGALAVVDSSYNYQAISDKWYEYFDLGLDDLIGQSVLDFSSSLKSPAWNDRFLRALAGEHLRGEDEKIQVINGTDYWIDWELVPWTNKDSQVAGLVISVEVLNEKKQLADQLEQTSEALKMAIQSSGFGFWQWVETTDELIWDDGMYALFEVDREQFTGKGSFFMQCLVSDDRPALEEVLADTLSKRGEYHIKYMINTQAGVKIIKEHGKVFEANSQVRMTGICEDITEEERLKQDLAQLNQNLEQKIQDRTEQLERSYEETRSLTYSLSHDLRAPLRAISAYTEAIAEDNMVPFAKEIEGYFGRIKSNSKKAIELIDDLLAYSRVIHQKLQFEELDSRVFLKEVINEIGEEATTRVELGEVPHFYGDATTLKQAFLNILDNALKFSSEDVVIYGEHKSGSVCVHVQDQGIGIATEDQDKIFEVFRKLNPDDEYEGSGIGLSLSKRILEINNGQIVLKSNSAKGSTFTLVLPQPS